MKSSKSEGMLSAAAFCARLCSLQSLNLRRQLACDSLSPFLGCALPGSWAIGSDNLIEVGRCTHMCLLTCVSSGEVNPNNPDCEAITKECYPASWAEVENINCVSSSCLPLLCELILLLPYTGAVQGNQCPCGNWFQRFHGGNCSHGAAPTAIRLLGCNTRTVG